MKLGLNQFLLALIGLFINIGAYNLWEISSDRMLLYVIIYSVFSIVLVRVLKGLALSKEKTITLQILWNVNLCLFILALVPLDSLIILGLIIVNGAYFISQQFVSKP